MPDVMIWVRVSDNQSDPRLSGTVQTTPPAGHPARIGRYVIERQLGQGGMGIVYAAHDDRLQRKIAIKTLPTPSGNDVAKQRLWREARAAAGVNHPNICQIYEVGEDEGQVFIAMELLDGEALSERLQREAMNLSDALPIALGILAALSALHARAIVHRDLKPSNVFLTTHGVKLLDFGLARPQLDASLDVDSALTGTGVVMGTPRYMSPEQIAGESVDARSDLFGVGVILFEMLTGRAPFSGRSLAEVFHATCYEQPPALTGSPGIAAADRVIRRALAKRADDRPASADEMAEELHAIRGAGTAAATIVARALTRLVVLPFRILRSDPETDFLAFSLPDAIATSLSRNPALVVRSNAIGARFAGETPDLKVLAAEVDVDRVVMGTLMRSGDQIRATAQLVDARAGTLLASQVVQSSMGELFTLQDDIARRVCEALSLPLSGEQLAADAPNDPRAYELYLRANELARTYEGLPSARDLYLRCLALDSRFAPAWAQLGRCHRVIGKYIDGAAASEALAETALRRALALSPRLSIAHKYYAQLEDDLGRAEAAMVRLLEEASRHGNDPELFAGLVHACRYCGLYEQSIAAHAEARRLDPNVPTSLDQTLLMTGDIDVLLAITPARVIAGADDGIRVIGLGLAGRRAEAHEKLVEMRQAAGRIPLFEAWIGYLTAWIDRRGEDMARLTTTFSGMKISEDPEAIFQEGWLLCDIGDHEAGLRRLQRAVAKGYFVSPTLASYPQFDALRDDARFQALLEQAEAGRQRALASFLEGGGARLIGA